MLHEVYGGAFYADLRRHTLRAAARFLAGKGDELRKRAKLEVHIVVRKVKQSYCDARWFADIGHMVLYNDNNRQQ